MSTRISRCDFANLAGSAALDVAAGGCSTKEREVARPQPGQNPTSQPSTSREFPLNQVRHHAVLGHGLAVQAIRARGPADTKVGLAENMRIAVPVLDTPEYVKAAETATREKMPTS
jgi:hypothetical protein